MCRAFNIDVSRSLIKTNTYYKCSSATVTSFTYMICIFMIKYLLVLCHCLTMLIAIYQIECYNGKAICCMNPVSA